MESLRSKRRPAAQPAPKPNTPKTREGLHYVSDKDPGYQRRRIGKKFAYLDPGGDRVNDEAVLARIRGLAIPPAYRDVWICMDPVGHLQATGIDARGRKQYRYHADWRRLRDQNKFEHLIRFALSLPKLRRRVRLDLLRPGLARDKVLAAVVALLESTLIRVGNDRYARENQHYGLTTLRERHVQLHGSHLRFRFVGKSGVDRVVELEDRRLAGIVRRLQDLPGQHLFQFRGATGSLHRIESSDVNAYLHRNMGAEFTAKDFRTWAATVFFTADVASLAGKAARPSSATLTRAVRETAERLGNTPAVCRKCYIHPGVIEAYLADGLGDLQWQPQEALDFRRHLHVAEQAVLDFLRREAGSKGERSAPARRVGAAG
jgi:DNA topoisomerase I